jgi:hypothetical protein
VIVIAFTSVVESCLRSMAGRGRSRERYGTCFKAFRVSGAGDSTIPLPLLSRAWTQEREMSSAGLQTIDQTEPSGPSEGLTPGETPAESPDLTQRRLLRAVERYRAGCAARGVAPSEEEGWLVLLAALRGEAPTA